MVNKMEKENLFGKSFVLSEKVSSYNKSRDSVLVFTINDDSFSNMAKITWERYDTKKKEMVTHSSKYTWESVISNIKSGDWKLLCTESQKKFLKTVMDNMLTTSDYDYEFIKIILARDPCWYVYDERVKLNVIRDEHMFEYDIVHR